MPAGVVVALRGKEVLWVRLIEDAPLAHGVGVGEPQHELAVVLVGAVANHVVLGGAVDVPQAFLQDVGAVQSATASEPERLGDYVRGLLGGVRS